MAGCGAAALIALKLPATIQTVVLVIGLVTYWVLMQALDHAWSRHEEASK